MRIAALCSLGLLLSLAQGGEDAPSGRGTLVAAGSCAESLFLAYRKDLPAPTRREALDPTRGPEGGPAPGSAFYVVERRGDGEFLRWIRYFSVPTMVMPLPGFAMAVVHLPDGTIYAIVLEARPRKAGLSAYRIGFEKSIGDLPVVLPPETGKPWPVADKPVGAVGFEWRREEVGPLARGGVAHVSALADARGILVSANAGAAPAYWRFDPKDASWARVVVEGSP